VSINVEDVKFGDTVKVRFTKTSFPRVPGPLEIQGEVWDSIGGKAVGPLLLAGVNEFEILEHRPKKPDWWDAQVIRVGNPIIDTWRYFLGLGGGEYRDLEGCVWHASNFDEDWTVEVVAP
jgi:hypothetical protein